MPAAKKTTTPMRGLAARAAASDANRRAILGCAKRLFAQHGYDGVSIRDIAAASLLSAPALYHFFGSKERLYEACRAEVVDAAALRLAETLNSAGDEAAQLRSATRALCVLVASDPLLLPFLQIEALRRATWLKKGPWALCVDDLAARIGVLARAGGVDDARGAAEAIVGYAIGQAIVDRAAGRQAGRVRAGRRADETAARVLRAVFPQGRWG